MILFWSFLFAIGHAVISIVLGLYFGLGMSPKGAWFVKNIIMQPGVGIAALLKRLDLSQPDRLVLLINFAFYFIIFLLIFYIRQRIKEKSMVV